MKMRGFSFIKIKFRKRKLKLHWFVKFLLRRFHIKMSLVRNHCMYYVHMYITHWEQHTSIYVVWLWTLRCTVRLSRWLGICVSADKLCTLAKRFLIVSISKSFQRFKKRLNHGHLIIYIEVCMKNPIKIYLIRAKKFLKKKSCSF